MVEYAYNPMRGKKKHVTQKDMLAVLAKHANPAIKVSEVIETPKAELPSLEWQKPEKYYVLSTCGRYSVSKGFDLGVARYTAWKRNPEFDFHIGIRDTPDEAKALCTEHLHAHPAGSRGSQSKQTAPGGQE